MAASSANPSFPAGDLIDSQVEEADAIARRIADALDHVGVLTVEFFACADGPLVNEIAPRVHNSGHWTIEGAETSQFEQHIRAVCGLPLGSTKRIAPRVTMDNLIGDEANGWPALTAEPGAHLHLYGKGEAKAGPQDGPRDPVGLLAPPQRRLGSSLASVCFRPIADIRAACVNPASGERLP